MKKVPNAEERQQYFREHGLNPNNASKLLGLTRPSVWRWILPEDDERSAAPTPQHWELLCLKVGSGNVK